MVKEIRRVILLSNSFVDGYRLNSQSQFLGIPAEEFWADLDFDNAWVDPGPSPAGNLGPYLKVPYPPEESVHRIHPMWEIGDHLWVQEIWGYYEVLSRSPERLQEITKENVVWVWAIKFKG